VTSIKYHHNHHYIIIIIIIITVEPLITDTN
jgi:hypothetical protein